MIINASWAIISQFFQQTWDFVRISIWRHLIKSLYMGTVGTGIVMISAVTSLDTICISWGNQPENQLTAIVPNPNQHSVVVSQSKSAFSCTWPSWRRIEGSILALAPGHIVSHWRATSGHDGLKTPWNRPDVAPGRGPSRPKLEPRCRLPRLCWFPGSAPCLQWYRDKL